MNARFALVMLVVLVVVIAAVAFFFSLPASAPASPGNATTTGDTQPLSSHVTLTTPAANATVGKSFAVSGEAPGPWYFEASFPIQVRDAEGNKIAQTVASAQGDWMTTALVPFTASVTIDGSYKGPATLVLLKDNPSGLPENDDSASVPIVIQ